VKGAYEGEALRREVRELWAREHVPSYGYGEVRPLRPLLSRWQDLTAIDVGANKGFWSKALLNNFPGQVRQVYMLDPSPENFRELTNRDDNLLFEEADFDHISAHNVAAGSASGRATLYTNEDGSPLASLHAHEATWKGVGFEPLRRAIEVPVVTLDDFMAEHGIAHVDVLKLDVEGHEFAVLEGASRALREGRIDVLIWEFGMHQVEARRFFVDFYDFLTERGYDLYEIPDEIARRIERYDFRFETFAQDVMYAARRRAAPPPPAPEGYDEAAYLAANRDVRRAVERGDFESGLQHWLQFGYREDRRLG
jgi:FkbM family methyltransferase